MEPDRAQALHHDRRWLILAVIGIAQLLVVLDVTIVNIALPSAQQELGFSDDDRQWVITAYALAFGSLLLLGGRFADLFGRKWTFIAGLVGFAGASALGGAAQSFELLVAARALQGVSAAVLAPAALSLLATTFTDPAERGKAFGIYAGIAGTGGAIGPLLGGARPTRSTGAGACTGRSPSRSRRRSPARACCTTSPRRPGRGSTSPGRRPRRAACSRSSSA
jgi:MFS family permease